MLTALVMGVAVIVVGDTTCPSAQRVSDVLSTLIAGTVERAEPHRAQLRDHGDTVEVELRSGLGRLLGHRTFPRTTSCDELASAIAVVIATWEAGMAGDTPEIVVAGPPQLPLPAARTTFTLGAGVLGSRDRSEWAAGGVGELSIGSTAGRWSARVAALATTRKREPLAPGAVAWARQALVVGARYRFAAGRSVTVDALGDVVLGVLMASGEGYTVNRTAYSFEPGVAAGARVTFGRGAIGVFLEATDTVWWRNGRLEVTGVSQMPDLPRHELHLSLGFVIRIAET